MPPKSDLKGGAKASAKRKPVSVMCGILFVVDVRVLYSDVCAGAHVECLTPPLHVRVVDINPAQVDDDADPDGSGDDSQGDKQFSQEDM